MLLPICKNVFWPAPSKSFCALAYWPTIQHYQLQPRLREPERTGLGHPAIRLKAGDPGGIGLPMTDAEIRAVEQVATSSAQRLIVALAAIQAARWAAIRDLTLEDLDLPNRGIIIAGHRQRLGELTAGRCRPGSPAAAPPGRTRPTGTS